MCLLEETLKNNSIFFKKIEEYHFILLHIYWSINITLIMQSFEDKYSLLYDYHLLHFLLTRGLLFQLL